MTNSPTNRMRRRMTVLMILFTVLLSAVLILRLADVQFVKGEEYQRAAVQQQMSSIAISASRGEILDTNKKKLAVSATVWNVIVDPSVVDPKVKDFTLENGQTIQTTEADMIADNLAGILEMDREEIKKKCLTPGVRSVYLKRRVEKDVHDEINSFLTKHSSIRSVYMLEDTKRYYPYGDLAANVIGFVNSDNVGGAGVESQYNKVLSGTPGMVVSARTGRGTDMPERNRQMYEAQNGYSLVLTIDESIQHFLEKHLEDAVIANNVKNGAVGIVMDVNTGAVLAMACEPDFDPNDYRTIRDPLAQERLEKVEAEATGTQEEKDNAYLAALGEEQNRQWRNKAISDPYEPGSVFKVVTAAAALDFGSSTPDSTFDCYGSMDVLGTKIGCWKEQGHGHQDFMHAIMHSCNPAFISIGRSLGAEAFYNYYSAFGFLEGTGIDLPGEANSISHTLEQLEETEVNLASSSFGQSQKVTAIQMLTACCAAVNGGKLLTPYVVRQVIDDSGNVVQSNEPKVRRQVISEQTSKTLDMMLEQVVADRLEGSGKNAYIAGYRIGGKTGTSQKLDKKISEDGIEEHWLSFFGCAPMDDPQIAVLVILDTPVVSNILSSTVAVPVARYILADVLPYVGIEQKFTAEEEASRDIPAPNVIGKTPDAASAALKEVGLNIKVDGDGPAILKQVPTPSTQVPRDATIIVYTDQDVSPRMVTVPDVKGMYTSGVNQVITGAGLNLSLAGGVGQKSVATRQSPVAGTEVEAGTIVEVEMVDTDVERPVTISSN